MSTKRHPVLRVFSYILVFLIGMIGMLAVEVGVVWFGYDSINVKKVLDKVYPAYTEYISEDFADNTVAGIVKELQNSRFENLDDVRKVSPYVDTLLAQASGALAEYGLHIDTQKLANTNWNAIGNYILEDVLYAVEIGPFLGIDGNADSLLRYLAYGSENEDYTVSGSEIIMAAGKSPRTLGALMDAEERTQLFNKLKLSDVMLIDESSPVILQKFAEKTLQDLDTFGQEIAVGDIIQIDENSPVILHTLKDVVIDDLGNKLNTITLKEIIEIDENSSPILQSLQDKTLSELENATEDIKISDLFEIDENSPAILQKLKDSSLKTLEDDLNNLVLGDVVTVNASSPMILRTLKTTKISDLGTKVNTLTLGQVIEVNSSSPLILQNLKNKKITELSAAFNDLKLKDVITIQTDSAPILQKLMNTKITELDGAVDSLVLGDIIKIDATSPAILQKLASTNLNNIATKVNTLRMEDILGAEAFGTNVVLDAIRNSTLETVAGDISRLTVNELFKNDIYDEHHNLTGVWKYMLTDKDTHQEATISMNDIEKMTQNVSANVNAATLSQLVADGLVVMEDPSALERQVTFRGHTRKIGDMTIAEMIEFVVASGV